MRGNNRRDDTIRPGGDAIPREVTLYGNGYGANYRPRNWPVNAEIKMGNNSDGCHTGHSVHVIEATLAKKPSDFLREEFSSNDLTLAENNISTNFNENTSLLV